MSTVPTDINTIVGYVGVDLTPFEYRGVKPGVGNASTTGPVYDGGFYIPPGNALTGTGFFDGTDSTTVTHFQFDATSQVRPYVVTVGMGLNALSLNLNDSLTVGADTTDTVTVAGAFDATTFLVSANNGYDGTMSLTFTLGQREYLIEPDQANVAHGDATFTKSSKTVNGVGTSWLTQLAHGDFIQHDGLMQTYVVDHVVSNIQAVLTAIYQGDSTFGAYTSTRVAIGRSRIQYVKDDFTFDNQGGRWKYDATTGSDVTTSASYMPFVDGLQLAFTPAPNVTTPGLMMTKSVYHATLSRQTQFAIDQFPLPVVPSPETSVEVFINGIKINRFPAEPAGYVINYSPNPVYEFPPAPIDRKVSSLMFLKQFNRTMIPQSITEDGHVQFLDSSGNAVTQIMPGSVNVWLDSTSQTLNEDFVLEHNAGLSDVVDWSTAENLVEYIAVDHGDLVNFGFEAYLNGRRLQWTNPRQTTDDIIFQPRTGVFKPATQSKPGPDDVYEFRYQVDGAIIHDEIVPAVAGSDTFRLKAWPVKRSTVFLKKNKVILTEGDDYRVSYQTGVVTLSVPMASSDGIAVTYTPLSVQANEMTYADGTMWCTTLDARLKVVDVVNFGFSVYNPAVNLGDSTVLRIYNETRSRDYNLTGATKSGQSIKLNALDSTNAAVGLAGLDTVLIDYKAPRANLEYAPVTVNTWVTPQGSSLLVLEGVDATSTFPVGSIVRLGQPDSAAQFYYFVTSATYTASGTEVGLDTGGAGVPDDIVNPVLGVTDGTVQFVTLPMAMSPAMSGAQAVIFPGRNIKNVFRAGTLLKIGSLLYSVDGATYSNGIVNGVQQNPPATTVQLNSTLLLDVTDAVTLNSVSRSTSPVYPEGTTELLPFDPVSALSAAPGLILGQDGTNTLPISVDAVSVTVGTIVFPKSDSTTVGQMASDIEAQVPGIQTLTYAPAWRSSKVAIQPTTQYIYKDSTVILGMLPALRLDGTDTTAFTLTTAGAVLLDSGIVRGQRYELDYLGRRFLSDSTVEASCDYFDTLPVKSKIQASFQYGNLDQFYVQVMSERQFLDDVIIPRMGEEAKQLAGNAGQGGDIPTDENSGNSAGGIVDDVYRLQDLRIECKVFKKIYDFFDGRVNAYGQELLAAEGLKMFNNDGPFDSSQQAYAVSGVNRIFPDTDYTNMEPMKVNPLTGYYTDGGAFFVQNDATVNGFGTAWITQLPVSFDSTCFFGRTDSTRRYSVKSVINDTKLALTIPFGESSTTDSEGDEYTATATYPAYDDDGYMGPKLNSSKSTKTKKNKDKTFGLVDGDTFACNLGSCTFTTPLVPLPPFNLLWSPPLMTASTIVSVLNSISGLQASVEEIVSPPGNKKKSVIVLRTTSSNILALGGPGNAAIAKLGFTPNSSSVGNRNRIDYAPESYEIKQEGRNLGPVTDMTSNEHNDLTLLDSSGVPNKFNRINLPMLSDLHNHVVVETVATAAEVNDLYAEIGALSVILQEPTLPAYNDAVIAYNDATNFLGYPYASTYVWPTQQTSWYDADTSNWHDMTAGWLWVLDWTDRTQTVYGVDATFSAVDHTGAGITPISGQSQFWLQAIQDAAHNDDVRITNWTVDTTDSLGYFDPPHVTGLDGTTISGIWYNWDLLSANKNSIDTSALFQIDDSFALFVMQIDQTRPNPTYTTTATALQFNWTEDEGAKSTSYNFSSYPTVSSLMAAADSTQGFGTFTSRSDILGYGYSNLKLLTGMVLGGAPGALISTGTQSPAIGMSCRRNFSVDANNLVLGDTTLSLSTYPTLGTLASAADALNAFSAINNFAPEYPSTNLIPVSGDVTGSQLRFNADVFPIGILFTPTDSSKTAGSYFTSPSVNPTDLNLQWMDGTTPMISTKSILTYTTLGAMVTAIQSEPQFNASLLWNAPSYPTTLKHVFTTAISTSSYTPVAMAPNDLAATLGSTPPAWQTDATALKLTFPDGAREYLYTTYPTLTALSGAIGSGTDMDSTWFYGNGSYAFGQLEINTGTVTPPAQTVVHFGTVSPAPLFRVYWDISNVNYSTDATALNLFWTQDTTSVGQTILYSDKTTVGAVRAAVDAVPGLDTTNTPDNTAYLTMPSQAFKITSGPVLYDASVYSGLRPCRVDYHTISDDLLHDRSSFTTDRSGILQPRQLYLDNVREPQIRGYLDSEGLLHATDGNTGDLWTWANNRWNRRQGSEARRSAQERQIAVNQSAAVINKMFQQ